jgi:uncharacterized membrane protein YidH (DUF202 family)
VVGFRYPLWKRLVEQQRWQEPPVAARNAPRSEAGGPLPGGAMSDRNAGRSRLGGAWAERRSKRFLKAAILGIIGGVVCAGLFVTLAIVFLSEIPPEGWADAVYFLFEDAEENPEVTFESEMLGLGLFYALVATLASIIAVINTFDAWEKKQKKDALPLAITYFFALNFPAMILCLAEYFGKEKVSPALPPAPAPAKSPPQKTVIQKPAIKEKSMLISVCLGAFSALILFLLFIFSKDDPSTAAIFFVLFAANMAALVCNFFARLKEKNTLTLIAAILYTIGILSIIPAIICYINHAIRKKMNKKKEPIWEPA